jgi:cell wall-associated NlpC family hydrolase
MNIPAAPMPPGQTLTGKVSWFGGPHDAETGSNRTATGTPSGAPGIAVYNRATLGGYWRVTAPNGKSAILKQTDLGPAPFTGRAVDVSSGALGRLGYSEANFPTDSQVKATFLGHSLPSGAQTQAPTVSRATTAPGPSGPVLNMGAFKEAQQKAVTNRLLLGQLGGGESNPLRLVLPTAEPEASKFEETKATPATTAGAPTAPVGPKIPSEGQNRALSAAVTQLGTPYRWGGEEEKKGFDCSGLTQWAYRAAGISIPRTAQEQFNASVKHTQGQGKPGELVFFGSGPGDVSHVGMIVRPGVMIDAAHTGTSVRYEPVPAVGSKWGGDTVLAIGEPTGKPGGHPPDAAVATGAGSVVGSYNAPSGPRAIVHVATGPHAGKIVHVAAKLPVGHQFQPGEILGAPTGLGGF